MRHITLDNLGGNPENGPAAALYVQALSRPIDGIGATYEEMKITVPLMEYIEDAIATGMGVLKLTDNDHTRLSEYLKRAPFQQNSRIILNVIDQVLYAPQVDDETTGDEKPPKRESSLDLTAEQLEAAAASDIELFTAMDDEKSEALARVSNEIEALATQGEPLTDEQRKTLDGLTTERDDIVTGKIKF